MITLFAAGENGYHLPPDINEVYWGTAAFLIVIGLGWWKAGPAIRKMMEGRTTRIQTELDEAAAARASAESQLTSASADLPDPTVEADRIRREAGETAERLRADIVAKAEVEAEAIRARGQADVASARASAQADLQAEVARVAREAATEAVSNSLDAPTHGSLIDDYINQVGRLG